MVRELFKAMMFGQELRQATGVKYAQGIVIACASVYWALKEFGFDLGWTESKLFSIAATIASVFSLWATFATSRKVGFGRRRAPDDYDDPNSEYEVNVPPEFMPRNGGSGFPRSPFIDGDY